MRARVGPPPLWRGLRWVAVAAATAVSGAAVLALSGAAHATAPTPNYHPGSDTATFTVTGVVDSNCPVSTGGTEIWIKPGDTINFNSSLAGIDVNGILLTLGQVSGLNVTAVIDPTTPESQTITVNGGQTTYFPAAAALAPGDHTITWQATSLSVLGGLAVSTAIPSGALAAGASLNWTGVVHVTSAAPTCKIAVGTPSVGVTLGPVKITVPPINIGVPVPIAVPTNLIPGAGTSKPPAGGTSGGPAARGTGYTPPGLTVPQQVMPLAGAGSGGFFGEALPDSGSSPVAGALPGNGAGVTATNANIPTGSGPATAGSGTQRAVELAANKAPVAQPPVVLAVIAIIALSLVTATFARLYLLRRHLP